MSNNENILTLASGFVFDYTHLYGLGKVTEDDLQAIAGKLADAHRAVGHMRASGEVRGHLSKDGEPEPVLFTQLPYIADGNLNSPASLARLEKFGQSLRNDVDAVVSFGIGGSYLGNKVLFDAHCGEFWNFKTAEARNGFPKLYFSGNNIDPRRTGELIEQILYEAGLRDCRAGARNDGEAGLRDCRAGARNDGEAGLRDCRAGARNDGEAGLRDCRAGARNDRRPYKVCLVVISKSGSTLDTMSAFMVVYDALKRQAPLVEVSVVAVTDPAEGEKATLLKKLAAEQGWQTFSAPDGVGGRFSIFSEAGLVTAACIGFDIKAFLAGAREMDQACLTADVRRNPAMLNAALKYIAAEKYGRDIEIFMPYGDYLKSVAEWYIQLLAESLGKRTDREGNEVFYGRTPVVAVGTTDMHAQTQQHQDGKKNKVVQFVKVGRWQPDPLIPDVFPNTAKLSEIADIRLSQALDAAREANAEALSGDNRFNATFVLPELNAYHLGELLYMLALSVAYEGELANVDAFDQPGVEAYKRLLGPRLKRLKSV